MTRPMRHGILTRAGLAFVATMSLMACGSAEPTTDAERLARGRELVQQMSARLAAATAVSVTTTETRDVVRLRGRKETVSQTGVYTVRRPNRFYSKMTGGRGLESWYNGKTLTIAVAPGQGVRAGADARHHRSHAGRAGRALRHGAADGRSVLRLGREGAALRHHHRRLRRHRERRRHAVRAPGLQGRRRGLGAVAAGARASRCRSDSRSCRRDAPVSPWST